MSEYIKKDSVIKSITSQIISDRDATIISEMMLADVPEEDVIDVVRCKDCMYMHANKNNRQLTCNRRMLGAVRPNDYCSLGAYEDGQIEYGVEDDE